MATRNQPSGNQVKFDQKRVFFALTLAQITLMQCPGPVCGQGGPIFCTHCFLNILARPCKYDQPQCLRSRDLYFYSITHRCTLCNTVWKASAFVRFTHRLTKPRESWGLRYHQARGEANGPRHGLSFKEGPPATVLLTPGQVLFTLTLAPETLMRWPDPACGQGGPIFCTCCSCNTLARSC